MNVAVRDICASMF